jgi:hypothetical protein
MVVVTGGRRLAIRGSRHLDDWYLPYSPRNGNDNAEGPWSDWVALAKEILRLEAERIAVAGQ